MRSPAVLMCSEAGEETRGFVDEFIDKTKATSVTSGAYNVSSGTITVSTIPRGELIGHGARTKTNLDAAWSGSCG